MLSSMSVSYYTTSVFVYTKWTNVDFVVTLSLLICRSARGFASGANVNLTGSFGQDSLQNSKTFKEICQVQGRIPQCQLRTLDSVSIVVLRAFWVTLNSDVRILLWSFIVRVGLQISLSRPNQIQSRNGSMASCNIKGLGGRMVFSCLLKGFSGLL